MGGVGGRTVDGSERTGCHRRLAFSRIDIDDDGALAVHGGSTLSAMWPEAAGPHDDDGLVLDLGAKLLERRIGGDAGARQRRRFRGIELAQIHAIALVRHEHVFGIAARHEDAHRAGLDGA